MEKKSITLWNEDHLFNRMRIIECERCVMVMMQFGAFVRNDRAVPEFFESVYDSFFDRFCEEKCNGCRDDMSSFRFVMLKLGYIE